MDRKVTILLISVFITIFVFSSVNVLAGAECNSACGKSGYKTASCLIWCSGYSHGGHDCSGLDCCCFDFNPGIKDLDGQGTDCNGWVPYTNNELRYVQWDGQCGQYHTQGGSGGIGTGCCETACGANTQCDEQTPGTNNCGNDCMVVPPSTLPTRFDTSGPATDCNGNIPYAGNEQRYSAWNGQCLNNLQPFNSGGIGQGCCEFACGAALQCDEQTQGTNNCNANCMAVTPTTNPTIPTTPTTQATTPTTQATTPTTQATIPTTILTTLPTTIFTTLPTTPTTQATTPTTGPFCGVGGEISVTNLDDANGQTSDNFDEDDVVRFRLDVNINSNQPVNAIVRDEVWLDQNANGKRDQGIDVISQVVYDREVTLNSGSNTITTDRIAVGQPAGKRVHVIHFETLPFNSSNLCYKNRVTEPDDIVGRENEAIAGNIKFHDNGKPFTVQLSPAYLRINCTTCNAGTRCNCTFSEICNSGSWMLTNQEGTPLNLNGTPKSVSGPIPPSRIEFIPNGTGKILVEAVCSNPSKHNDTTLEVREKVLDCPSTCEVKKDCRCVVYLCNSGKLFVQNHEGTPLTSEIIGESFAGTYERTFQPSNIGKIAVRAICYNPEDKTTPSPFIITVVPQVTTTTTPVSQFTVPNFQCLQSGQIWNCNLNYNNGLIPAENVVLILTFADKTTGRVKATQSFPNLGSGSGSIPTYSFNCANHGTGTYYVSWRAYKQSDMTNPINWSITAEKNIIVCG
jgi:hypothetical protein